MEIGKIKYAILKLIFIIALLLPVVMIVKSEIEVNVAISNTRKIFNSIDTNEMQEKIIAKLEKSKINIDSDEYKVKFQKFQDIDESILELCTYDINDKSKNDFVYEVITDKKERNAIAIPLFKITSYTDDTFANIEYINDSKWFDYEYDNAIYNAVNDVFKQYGLERGMGYYGMRYYAKYYGPYHKPSIIGDEMSILYKDIEFAQDVISEIVDYPYDKDDNTERKNYYYKELIQKKSRTVFWGILD